MEVKEIKDLNQIPKGREKGSKYEELIEKALASEKGIEVSIPEDSSPKAVYWGVTVRARKKNLPLRVKLSEKARKVYIIKTE